MPRSNLLEYDGSNFLRLRLVLATLSGRSVKIRKIRSKDDSPGLNQHEASLIRLFDKITNGSKFEVSETGTTLLYHPGILTGGKVEHDCNPERGIGYYLEPLMAMAAFCKEPLEITLRGVTSNRLDSSPDLLKNSAIPILKRFIVVDDGLELKIQRRGSAPGGGGQVLFRCPTRRSLKPIQFLDQGKIKRIRGVAWATRVSPAVPNRMIEKAKGVLLKFIPDVYIVADQVTGVRSGKSPGFGLVLTAETTTGVFLSAEVTSKQVENLKSGEKKEPTIPEELGVEGSYSLFEEIYRGGCVDSTSQSLVLLLMSLGPRDVSKVVIGPLSTYTVHFLRHLKDFFGTVFKLETYKEIKDDDEAEDSGELRLGVDKVLATCVGIGYTNLGKRTT